MGFACGFGAGGAGALFDVGGWGHRWGALSGYCAVAAADRVDDHLRVDPVAAGHTGHAGAFIYFRIMSGYFISDMFTEDRADGQTHSDGAADVAGSVVSVLLLYQFPAPFSPAPKPQANPKPPPAAAKSYA